MEVQGFISMVLFAALMTGTPGPNNMLLTFSGANFGYLRTIPQMLGIFVGLSSLLLLMGAGFSWVLQSYPQLHFMLKLLGSTYLLYLAWRVLRAGKASSANMAKPMRFHESVLFQYLNPKAWMMSSSAVASFAQTGEAYWWSILALILAFAVANPITNSLWVNFGRWIARFLESELARLRFNQSMALMLVLCISVMWL